jgi:hypothetical protein
MMEKHFEITAALAVRAESLSPTLIGYCNPIMGRSMYIVRPHIRRDISVNCEGRRWDCQVPFSRTKGVGRLTLDHAHHYHDARVAYSRV